MTDLSLVLDFRRHLRECTACELRQHAREPVPFSGDINPTYALLGEAPGSTEDKEGRPFIGSAGQRMRHYLRQVGLDPEKITWLNSACCFPGPIRTPTTTHLRACRGWLNGSLQIIRPKVLITVGVVAFSAIWHETKWPTLQMIHGKPLHHPDFGYKVWSTYHPSAVLRGSKKYEKIILDDLRALVDWDGCALEECYICGDELEAWDTDGRGIGLCGRHGARQGVLL